jgi:hypothetical protein
MRGRAARMKISEPKNVIAFIGIRKKWPREPCRPLTTSSPQLRIGFTV